MSLFWVVGAGGLLGSHVVKQMPQVFPGPGPGATLWPCVVPRFSWLEPPVLRRQLDQALRAFADQVKTGGHRSFAILWAAGLGNIASPARTLAGDTEIWEYFLATLDAHLPPGHDGPPGSLVWASSAGAVYGKSPADPLTEESPCLPISDYGAAKLRQEAIARSFAGTRKDLSLLTCRISSLYGPGQNLKKAQGLISHLSRCILYRRPVHLYVPLDSIRDYLYVADCAQAVLRCLARMQSLAQERGRAQEVLKIFSGEQVASIAQVLAIFGQIARQKPQIVSAQSPLGVLHPLRMSFRSRVFPEIRPSPPTSLMVGISQTHQHQLALFQRGLLPA